MPGSTPIIDDETAVQWDTFIQALKELKADPGPAGDPALERLRIAFAHSRFVSRQCIRRAGLAAELIRSGDLMRRYAPEDWTRELHCLIEASAGPVGPAHNLTESAFQDRLRIYRQREMVRIAVRDLAGLADLAETLEDLSSLADRAIQQALDFLYRRQIGEWGTPQDRDGIPQQLVILGMGKLGARELNFSSDVDLIFTYPAGGNTSGGIKTTSNEDFFVRLCRRLIQTIGANTAEGFVFRVDARLRPFGDAGALALSFDRMLDYYETHGREWERYALIKARVVAGDKTAGRQLLDDLKPFVFRRYLDYNTFDALRDMKHRIAAEVRSKGLQDNIKLGPGGIREIEFFGQMFQLLRGGVQPELQARPILTILQRLAGQNLISVQTEQELKAAYVFLRRTENRIQAHADQQRHVLPTADPERRCLAAAMGFESWEAFLGRLAGHRGIVQHQFDALLKNSREASDADPETAPDELDRPWQPNVAPEEARQILGRAGFSETAKALQIIGDLQEDRNVRAMSPTGASRLANIMPALLRETGKVDRPQIVLSRLFDLIKSICRRTSYLSLLWEYPAALENLVRLFEASPWIAKLLCRHPVLLDELLDPRTLFRPPQRAELIQEVRARLAGIPADDLEQQMEVLRIFKQANLLRVAASDVTNVLPLMRVSDHLTELAEVVLAEVVQLSWDHLVAKHGRPDCRLDDQPCGQGFAVIAYGKLGGWELGYRSDLDLVFLHAAAPGQTQGGQRPIDNTQFFARLGQRVLHLLTAHTPAGILYDTDMRLRPSGDSGLLVSHLDGFRAYQLDDAWTWEHQALIRARAIIGDPSLKQQFENVRLEILSQAREPDILRHEVVSMREKLRQAQADGDRDSFDIKQGAGGIVDIEFLVQYLILQHTRHHGGIARWTDNVRQLQELATHRIIDNEEAFGLRRAYLILRAMGHRLNLKELSAHIDHERFTGARNFVRSCWRKFLTPEDR